MTKRKTLLYTVEPISVAALRIAQATKRLAVIAYKKATEKNGNLCHSGEQFVLAKWALVAAIECEEIAFDLQKSYNRLRDEKTGRFSDVKVSLIAKEFNWTHLTNLSQLVKDSVAEAYKIEKKNKKAKAA
jgi:hypothetical protein